MSQTQITPNQDSMPATSLPRSNSLGKSKFTNGSLTEIELEIARKKEELSAIRAQRSSERVERSTKANDLIRRAHNSQERYSSPLKMAKDVIDGLRGRRSLDMSGDSRSPSPPEFRISTSQSSVGRGSIQFSPESLIDEPVTNNSSLLFSNDVTFGVQSRPGVYSVSKEGYESPAAKAPDNSFISTFDKGLAKKTEQSRPRRNTEVCDRESIRRVNGTAQNRRLSGSSLAAEVEQEKYDRLNSYRINLELQKNVEAQENKLKAIEAENLRVKQAIEAENQNLALQVEQQCSALKEEINTEKHKLLEKVAEIKEVEESLKKQRSELEAERLSRCNSADYDTTVQPFLEYQSLDGAHENGVGMKRRSKRTYPSTENQDQNTPENETNNENLGSDEEEVAALVQLQLEFRKFKSEVEKSNKTRTTSRITTIVLWLFVILVVYLFLVIKELMYEEFARVAS